MDENCSSLPPGNADVGRSPESKPRIEFDEVGKLSPNDRAESPDSNCAICLGKLQNKSFTDSCLHQFCFTCLLEWSKVKAECPLCKQSFKSIIHNVRSIEDYDQYHLRQPEPRITMQNFPYSLIDDSPRFRYRTTMAPAPPVPLFGYLQRLEHMMSHGEIIPPGFLIHPPRPWRSGSHSNGSSTSNSSSRRQRAMSSNFPDLVTGTSSFRRNIYNNNLWVRRVPDLTGRFRECSAEFFLNNPAQVHRLVPWLNRELNVLLAGTEYQSQDVVSIILELLPRHNIRSHEFRNALLPYFGNRVDHFIHEFYAFGTSPYDMVGYDRICLYGPPFNYSDDELHLSDTSWDSDVQVVDVVHSETSANTSTTNVPSVEIPHPEVGSPVAGPSHAPDNQNLSLIAVSSELDSDGSDCLIVGSVKPRHLRTPEVITLDSDSDVEPCNGIQQENISSEDSEVDRKPLLMLEKSGRQTLCTRSKVEQRNRCAEISRRASCMKIDGDEIGRKQSYSKSSSRHSIRDFSPLLSSTSPSSSNDSDEDWNAPKKSMSRKYKKDKRKRPASSKKKAKESSKKKKSNKEKKSKPIRHWKKKLCSRKIESSSSSEEEITIRSNRKRKIIQYSSSDSPSDNKREVNHEYVNPYSELHQKRSHSSRLRSVVHVKNKAQDGYDSQSVCRSCHSSTPSRETDRGPSTSSGITSHCSGDYAIYANDMRPQTSRWNRSQCSSSSSLSSSTSISSSSSSSSVLFTSRKRKYRKVKSKRKHI